MEALGPEQCRREHEPEEAAVQALEQPTVAREERAEGSPGGLGQEVDEDDVLSRGEPNRELLWKVPDGPGPRWLKASAGSSSAERPYRSVKQATFSRSVPSQVVSAWPSTTSSTMRRSTALATVAGRRCRLFGSPIAR